MNIDLNSAQKSAVTCWRHLLRVLDQLPSQSVFGREATAKQTFVSEGIKTHSGFQEIFKFFTSDIGLDTETRKEILCANIDDILALDVLSDFPKNVLTSVLDPEITKQIEETKIEATKFEQICADEKDWDMKELYEDDWNMELERLSKLQKQEYKISIQYDAYLKWVFKHCNNE